MITHASVAQWLEDYVAAWKSYDPEAIGQLFSQNADYRYHPWDDPITGRETIIAAWLENRDQPGTFEATYTPSMVEGQRAVAIGSTRYFNADGTVVLREYHNLFLMTFADDGTCCDFTEWYMHQSTPATTA